MAGVNLVERITALYASRSTVPDTAKSIDLADILFFNKVLSGVLDITPSDSDLSSTLTLSKQKLNDSITTCKSRIDPIDLSILLKPVNANVDRYYSRVWALVGCFSLFGAPLLCPHSSQSSLSSRKQPSATTGSAASPSTNSSGVSNEVDIGSGLVLAPQPARFTLVPITQPKPIKEFQNLVLHGSGKVVIR